MLVRRQAFRLYPNKAQTKALFESRRLHAYLYNACIEHRKTEYERFGRSVSYFDQQNCLPAFKDCWLEYKQLHSQALQATVKRVDLAYNSFFQGLRKPPKFKSIRDYSGWTYAAKSGWKANTEGTHGTVTLNDLGITLRMRGKAKDWGTPTTLTIVYKPYLNQWFASITVEILAPQVKEGSQSPLEYESIAAIDLGTETALTLYNGKDFEEVINPRFIRKAEKRLKVAAKLLRRKRAPNRKKKVKASNRWKKARSRVSRLQRKVAAKRKDWQHKVTTDIASRHDIVVTEKLETKKMTRKGKKRKAQKAGLNKSILDVSFGTLNQMITYKVEGKGGLVVFLPTRELKPSQRCPKCGAVCKEWAELSNRYHVCKCGFEMPRDKTSTVVMYQALLNKQPGFGMRLDSRGCPSSTSKTKKRKHTGSMKQLGQKKRQKLQSVDSGALETPSVYTAG